MAERRQTGRKRPPDREAILRQSWLDVIESLDARTLVIGGKSNSA
jgi:predicted alpha/beta-hydrolase family hydrolase